VALGDSGLIREGAFGDSGLIREVAFAPLLWSHCHQRPPLL
jgi:hypothetical protein